MILNKMRINTKEEAQTSKFIKKNHPILGKIVLIKKEI